jgi:hypothetical protein
LIRAASATPASVWDRNTTTMISDSAAASTANGASSPSVALRRKMIRAIGREAANNAATAIRPCGASVADNIATMIAVAAGTRRRVAIAVSASTQVATTPSAISGSGRRPLLNGSHAARNTAPAVHTAIRLLPRLPRPGPSRRSM